MGFVDVKTSGGGETLTPAQVDELTANTATRHTHDNKTILDATTGIYTTAEKTKLGNLTDSWKGVFPTAAALNTAYPSPVSGWAAWVTATSTVWDVVSGAWANSGATSIGDMLKATYDPQGKASDAFVVFTGASSSAAGKEGRIPAPSQGMQDCILNGDGSWHCDGRLPYLTIANQTANVTLTASNTIDKCASLGINQSTSGIIITIPIPTASDKSRNLRVVNTGSVSFYLWLGYLVAPNKCVDLHYSAALNNWVLSSSDVTIWDSSVGCKSGMKVWAGNLIAVANGDIASNSTFVWGTTGATFSPIFPNENTLTYNWRGVYQINTSYAVGDIFVTGTTMNFLFFKVTSAFTSSANGWVADFNTAGGVGVSKIDFINLGYFRINNSASNFVGATSTTAGRQGSAPAPQAGDQQKFLRADSTWQYVNNTYASLKTIKFTTIMSATLGAQTLVPHGLTASKIRSITGMANSNAGYIPPDYINTSYQYALYADATNIVIQPNAAANALQGVALTIVVTYEE